MPKCQQCDKETFFPFRCNYCGKDYCEEHRLPESHDCVSLPKKQGWYSRQRKDADLSELQKEKRLLSFVKRKPFKSSNKKASKVAQLLGSSQPRNIILSLRTWFLFFWIVVGFLYLAERSNPNAFYQSVPEIARYILYAFTIGVAIWTGYEVFKKFDYSPSSDKGIFGLKLLSFGVMIVAVLMFTFGFLILGIFSLFLKQDSSIVREMAATFLITLSLALLITSGYLIFKFERKSGIIVYRR
jgi:hypothetical protein